MVCIAHFDLPSRCFFLLCNLPMLQPDSLLQLVPEQESIINKTLICKTHNNLLIVKNNKQVQYHNSDFVNTIRYFRTKNRHLLFVIENPCMLQKTLVCFRKWPRVRTKLLNETENFQLYQLSAVIKFFYHQFSLKTLSCVTQFIAISITPQTLFYTSFLVKNQRLPYHEII